MKIRVYYEDTDAGGIVYHTNYIKYCERARSEVFFLHGLKPLEGDVSGFVVHHISADFISTASLGDILEVKSKVLALKRTYMILQQNIHKNGQKIFSMEIKLAYLSHAKISRIPKHFLTILENML
ncbi:MAG: YbgC/FadM family acyl-CoA thioesterase [Sulfurovum sp.]|nr:YbgC/FadM family acyl-CoA thioesterase [Sulfurovum sp.]